MRKQDSRATLPCATSGLAKISGILARTRLAPQVAEGEPAGDPEYPIPLQVPGEVATPGSGSHWSCEVPGEEKICQPALIASLIARSAMSVGHDRRRDASRQERFPNGLHGAIPHGVGGISSMSTRTSASAVESANLSSEAAANEPAGPRRRSRRGRGESAITSSTGRGLAGTGAVRAVEPVAR